MKMRMIKNNKIYASLLTIVTLFLFATYLTSSGSAIEASEDKMEETSEEIVEKTTGSSSFEPINSIEKFASENVSENIKEETQTSSSSEQAMEPAKETKAVTRGISESVTDWSSFIRALADPSVSHINVIQSFAVPSNPRAGLTDILLRDTSNLSGYSQYVGLDPTGVARKVVIEGNNNNIDFGAICITYYDRNLTGTSGGWDLTWQNLNVYHGNIYGFTTLNDLSQTNQRKSKMTYHNVTDVGSQLIHSPDTDVVLSGKVSTNQTRYYTSPFRTNWESDDENQINLMITNLTVAEGAIVDMSSLRGGNILLRNGGSLILEKNSKMVVKASQNDLTGEGDAAQTNLRIQGGTVTLREGAVLDMTPKPNYSSMTLTETGSSVSIGKDASIIINSNGHTNNSNGDNRNIVYLAGGATLEVASGGKLDIKTTGMGTSNSNIVHVAGTANFIVRKKGMFSIVSDSTSPTQALLNFTNASSKFQFADALLVNLQRTEYMNAGGGLIRIAGSGGKLDVDIQKVSRWGRGNLTATPTATWTPMYGMLLTYNEYAPTVATVSSLLESNITDFRSRFTTRDTQRVLFEYIPDVGVVINSMATDEQASVNSTTVYGTTNPGAYVRLSDVPVNGTVATVLPKSGNTIKSPVTSIGASADFSENFTVQADALGNYSYILPGNKHFSAGTVIKAYSFLNGKYASVTQTVLDKTPPSGEARAYHAGKGTAVPNPKGFVTKPTDSNPVSQNYTYAYASDNPVATIQGMLNVVGEHTVKVDLFDNANNKTTITSKLIVHDAENTVNGTDLEIGTNILRGMTNTEIEAFVLTNANQTAQKIIDGVHTDLSDKVQVSNLGSLSSASTAGPYIVTLTVKKADSGLTTDIHKDIIVTVKDSSAVLTVNFVNEANQILRGYTVLISGLVGDTIDLTQQSTVQTQLSNVTNAGYDIVARPTNETAVSLNNAAVMVQYKVQGVISLASVPSTLGFGSLSYEAATKRIDNPTVDKKLIITDTRADASTGFKMTATLSTPMTNVNGKTLANALRYVYKGSEKVLDVNAQEVYINSSGATGNYTVSDTWGDNKGTDGVKLQLGSSEVVYTGDYTGVITWKVMAGQP